jgi:hypothetical protein
MYAIVKVAAGGCQITAKYAATKTWVWFGSSANGGSHSAHSDNRSLRKYTFKVGTRQQVMLHEGNVRAGGVGARAAGRATRREC